MQLRRTIQAPFPNSTATAVAAGQSAAVEGLNLLRKLAWQLLVSLMFLKDQGVLHADLKPENILFRSSTLFTDYIKYFTRMISVDANMHAKVIDFGNALSINEVSAYYQDFELQSILYRAPEVCHCVFII
jgi:dual specificity protein kinase YAK1